MKATAVRRRFAILIGLLLPGLLAGCWDAEEVQTLNYISSLGVDYKDGQYDVYGQMLDFGSIAKVEGPPSKAQSWVGHARSFSVADAGRMISETSQRKLYLGHIVSVVMTEEALRSGKLPHILDAMLRRTDTRYTKWFFATKQPLDKILSAKAFFNRSSLETTLNEPIRSYNQFSVTNPIYMNDLVADLRESNSVVFVPEISLDESIWAQDDKPFDTLVRKGAFVLEGNAYRGYLDHKTMMRGRWTEPSYKQSQLAIGSAEGGMATLLLARQKIAYKIDEAGGRPSFTLRIRLAGRILNMEQEQAADKLERLAEERVKADILSFYDSGLRIHADVLGLGHRYYKNDPHKWKKAAVGGRLPILKPTLSGVEVTCELRDTGSYKMRKS
ncbi:Ger(x)C family spore germination protein [Cohnella sp. JJ-181]|uniref:Ger(x)C family spore germination protein n=1 Tax=Cohnella rhizoplanae TaxID=2974897 RepID=UPI0022FF9553|nr:Ger(x)C family spore germination protein [Cohnella sp. JJ-181]CAI6033776.1 hypothetical protein COHCIP112018_00811 [Cohnella sp. JJ-181]